MSAMTAEPLERTTFDAATLMAEHPPRWQHPNKEAVFRLACPPGTSVGGTLEYSRWEAMPLPESPPATPCAIDARPDRYDYRPVAGGGRDEWHVNFADPRLFVAYGSRLLAQDELQVAEHPVLGSLREALVATGRAAATVGEKGATPVLVRGAERRVAIDTDPDLSAGRQYGLYGNRFAAAPVEVVEGAVTVLRPPTVTNLIAIAAPAGGRGTYRREEIERIVRTAYSGFAAARLESVRAAGAGARVAVHTGFWGCGAFGGNRTLMALLQLVAATLAKVDTLVFHAFNREGQRTFGDARQIFERDLSRGSLPGVATLLDRVTAMNFKWGESDGN